MKMLMRARCSGAAIIVLAPTAITVHAQKRNGMEDRFANIKRGEASLSPAIQ